LQPGLAPAAARAIAKSAASRAMDALALTASLVSGLVEKPQEKLLPGLADDDHVIALVRVERLSDPCSRAWRRPRRARSEDRRSECDPRARVDGKPLL